MQLGANVGTQLQVRRIASFSVYMMHNGDLC